MNGVGGVEGAARGMHARRAAIAAALAVVPVLLFLNKALHIDDPLFVWTAQHLLEDPVAFYGFDVNWYGVPESMHAVNQNPPLFSYYLVLFGVLFGWREWGLHLAMMPLAALTGAGAYLVARRFCAHPLTAAATAVLTPVFLVSATTLMCDVPMLALWLWAMHCWIVGRERRSAPWFLVSGLLVAACALTKYFGVSLIPLLLVYTLLRGRGARIHAAWLILPVALLGLYEWGTARLYGRGLLWDAVSYASGFHESDGNYAAKACTTLAFLGGCLVFPLLFSPWLWSRRTILGGIVFWAMLFAAFLWTPAGRHLQDIAGFAPSAGYFAQVSLWLVGGAATLLLLVPEGGMLRPRGTGVPPVEDHEQDAHATCGTGVPPVEDGERDARITRRADRVVLVLWLVGTVFFAAFVNHYVNGRVILPAAVPAAILAARRFEHARSMPACFRLAPFVVSAVLGLMVAGADYRLAENGRVAAHDTMDRAGDGHVWFVGHWGFQYYMERRGARAVDLSRPNFKPGEVVVIPENNTNLIRLGADIIASTATLEYPAFPGCATMHQASGAGFYSDVWGRLPFVFTAAPPERYVVVTVAPKP